MKKIVVLFAAVALVSAFSIPASAAEWSFYGSARMSTFRTEVSKEVSEDAYYQGNGLGFDDEDTTWELQGNSRIGAKIEAGNVRGQFEYGAWNFGAGDLLIGRGYTPTHASFSNQVFFTDNDLNGFGTLWSRKDMVQLTRGGFRLALVKPETGDIDGLAGADYDTTIPMIAARYEKSFDWLRGRVPGRSLICCYVD